MSPISLQYLKAMPSLVLQSNKNKPWSLWEIMGCYNKVEGILYWKGRVICNGKDAQYS